MHRSVTLCTLQFAVVWMGGGGGKGGEARGTELEGENKRGGGGE